MDGEIDEAEFRRGVGQRSRGAYNGAVVGAGIAGCVSALPACVLGMGASLSTSDSMGFNGVMGFLFDPWGAHETAEYGIAEQQRRNHEAAAATSGGIMGTVYRQSAGLGPAAAAALEHNLTVLREQYPGVAFNTTRYGYGAEVPVIVEPATGKVLGVGLAYTSDPAVRQGFARGDYSRVMIVQSDLKSGAHAYQLVTNPRLPIDAQALAVLGRTVEAMNTPEYQRPPVTGALVEPTPRGAIEPAQRPGFWGRLGRALRFRGR